MTVQIHPFFDPQTYTYSYVVSDQASGQALIIDSVYDYDPASGRVSTRSADAIVEFVESRELNVRLILETHAHADHLSAAQYLKRKLGGETGIGRRITEVQEIFGGVFNLGAGFASDGSQFDLLFDDGDTFEFGAHAVRVMHTPGHTPACVTYVVNGAAFVGDTLFMPDYGTARTDFPGGDAATLYASIQKILSLPENTRLYMCHDYLAPGRNEYHCETTVALERSGNIHVHEGIAEADFVAMREARDADLAAPRLLLPSVQFNIRAGHFPEAEGNGTAYFKIPIRNI